ncbi:MAG: glycosyltransferase [Lachnospiraceae bacterium]|nr:glycosyltransferase [Lachnospiraceae bacterium]
MSKYLLSFCIPTYNHSAMIYRIVTNILQCKSERIQIVASDDASDDDTVSRLREITDERFKLVTAPQRAGAKMNWYRALMHGDGKWLYLLIGRDTVNPYKIDALLETLEALENKNVGFVRESLSVKKRIQVYSSKEALKHLLDFAHPSGSIFLREAFRAEPDKENYFATADTYPENYVKRDIIKDYPCAEIKGIIYTGKTIVPIKHVRSLYEPKTTCPFYHPKRSTIQFLEIIDMIEQPGIYRLSQKEQDELFLYKWKFLLYNITFYQRIRFLSPGFLGHYGEKKRKVKRTEMIRNMIHAYKDVSAHYDKISFYRSKIMIQAIAVQSVKILFWSDSKIASSKWQG